jgi:hypothetical protein
MQTDSEVVGTTNIRIDLKTKDKLSSLGKHGDSFNSIIEMLIWEHHLLESIAKDHPDIVQKKKR